MLAVRWHGREDVRVEEIPPPPEPGEGEVRLKVSWCGICGTDVEEWREGPMFVQAEEPHPITGRRAPIVLGHEFGGVVEKVGPGVEALRPGTRVAVDTAVYCGACHWCRRNRVILCERVGYLGFSADGGLAELCNAPARMCLPVPEGLSDEAVPLTETLSVGVRALRRGRLQPGERVVIVGAGPIGLMALQAAQAFGAGEVVVAEPSARRRELAARLGAGRVVSSARGAEGDVVLECAGRPEAVEAALAGTRKGGRTVLIGIHPRPASFRPFDLILGEREIVGSLSHVWDEDFKAALALLGRGVVRAEPVITDRVALEGAVEDGLGALLREPDRHLKIIVGGRA